MKTKKLVLSLSRRSLLDVVLTNSRELISSTPLGNNKTVGGARFARPQPRFCRVGVLLINLH